MGKATEHCLAHVFRYLISCRRFAAPALMSRAAAMRNNAMTQRRKTTTPNLRRGFDVVKTIGQIAQSTALLVAPDVL